LINEALFAHLAADRVLEIGSTLFPRLALGKRGRFAAIRYGESLRGFGVGS